MQNILHSQNYTYIKLHMMNLRYLLLPLMLVCGNMSYLSVCLSLTLSLCLSLPLSIFPPSLSVSLCLCLFGSVCLSVSLLVCLCLALSVSLSLSLSVCLSLCLSLSRSHSLCLSLALSVYLSLSLSYLNPTEERDIDIERNFFKQHPQLGKFVGYVLVGTLFPPPQSDPDLIKVGRGRL